MLQRKKMQNKQTRGQRAERGRKRGKNQEVCSGDKREVADTHVGNTTAQNKSI